MWIMFSVECVDKYKYIYFSVEYVDRYKYECFQLNMWIDISSYMFELIM